MVFDDLNVLSEPTRARLLRLLDECELGVGEMSRILQLPQSTVSRHLKVLLNGQWVARRSAGTSGFFHLPTSMLSVEAKQLWGVVKSRMSEGDFFPEDSVRLQMVLSMRSPEEVGFFGREAAHWDAMRTDLFGREYLIPLFAHMLEPKLRVADLGCGTGELVSGIAAGVHQVHGVDREPAMLELARKRVKGLENVNLMQGALHALPLENHSVDLGICSLVLHHVQSLPEVLQEIHRILVPGGRLVIIDMVSHGRTEYRKSMGHVHLGFEASQLEDELGEAGLILQRFSHLPLSPAVNGPGLFVASATTWE